MNIETELIKQLIRNALKELICRDHILLDVRVKEEAINHRFAIYIEQEYHRIFPDGPELNFDLEYNRNYFNEKELLDENDERIRFRPDLIIHQRISNERNKIAFELKKGYPDKKDKRTIRGVLQQPFNYSVSVLLSYLPGKANFRIGIFKLGEEPLFYRENKIDLANE